MSITFKRLSYRENAIRIGEKEEKEKEVRSQIVEEAIDFKNAFYEKRKIHIENNKTTNREKEKVKIYAYFLLCSSLCYVLL